MGGSGERDGEEGEEARPEFGYKYVDGQGREKVR